MGSVHTSSDGLQRPVVKQLATGRHAHPTHNHPSPDAVGDVIVSEKPAGQGPS
jgi:hypothetical protein